MVLQRSLEEWVIQAALRKITSMLMMSKIMFVSTLIHRLHRLVDSICKFLTVSSWIWFKEAFCMCFRRRRENMLNDLLMVSLFWACRHFWEHHLPGRPSEASAICTGMSWCQKPWRASVPRLTLHGFSWNASDVQCSSMYTTFAFLHVSSSSTKRWWSWDANEINSIARQLQEMS